MNEMHKYTIEAGSTVRDAMVLIEENKHRSLIILREGFVIGTLSDGDIRRLVLDGHLLDTPVENAMNSRFFSLKQESFGQAKDVFEQGVIFLIPIVDGNNRLVSILTKKQVLAYV